MTKLSINQSARKRASRPCVWTYQFGGCCGTESTHIHHPTERPYCAHHSRLVALAFKLNPIQPK
jgi:hypothetical protein